MTIGVSQMHVSRLLAASLEELAPAHRATTRRIDTHRRRFPSSQERSLSDRIRRARPPWRSGIGGVREMDGAIRRRFWVGYRATHHPERIVYDRSGGACAEPGGHRREGPERRGPRAHLLCRGRGGLDRTGLQPGRHPRLRGHRHRRPAGAHHHHPGLRPDAVHLLRLQGDELRRPRLRHHLHLGRAGLRAEDRLVGRLGHRGRRPSGHGQPGPDRRPVRLPPLQRQRDRPQFEQRLGPAGRRHLDRGDDVPSATSASRSRPTSRRPCSASSSPCSWCSPSWPW